MLLDYVSTLTIQLEIQSRPRDPARFAHYLRTILTDDRQDVALTPLVAANPMAREHVTDILRALIDQDVDRHAEAVVAEVRDALRDVEGQFRIGLVVIDDLMGGWTNRAAVEHALRFPEPSATWPNPASTPLGADASTERPAPKARDGWITAPLWSSEPASLHAVREAILTTVHRVAYVIVHGPPRTLREKMRQEGIVLARAGVALPELDPGEIAYTRAVIEPFLDADDMRTAVECLFGDSAARTLGFTPRGLSPYAGLHVALHDALAQGQPR